MPDISDLPAYLRERGFRVTGVPGWRSRRRPVGKYNPRGIVVHHTGGTANGMKYAAGLLTKGYVGLPGPLCQIALNRDGTVVMIAAGRANHAGKTRKVGFMSAGDGNTQSLGIEAMNTGTEGWKQARPKNPFGTQYNAYTALCAAICDFFGWSRSNVLGHGETSLTGKWDPGASRGKMIDMPAFRADVCGVSFVADQPAAEPEPPARIGKFQLINHGAASAALTKPLALTKWLARRKNVVKITRDKKPDVLGGLECGGGNAWHYISTKYRNFGQVLVVNAGGRALWRNGETTSEPVDKGIFVPSKWEGDAKEVPWFVGKIGGATMLTALAHLDPDATVSHNKKVAGEIVAFLTDRAAQHGIGRSQIVLMIDMADRSGTVRRVLEAAGFASVYDVAARTVGADLASMTYFRAPVKGVSVDDIFVWLGKQAPGKGPDRPRPVEVASKSPGAKHTDLDHLVLAAILNRQ